MSDQPAGDDPAGQSRSRRRSLQVPIAGAIDREPDPLRSESSVFEATDRWSEADAEILSWEDDHPPSASLVSQIAPRFASLDELPEPDFGLARVAASPRWTTPGARVPEAPPNRLGRYEVLGELGRGGMGRVLAGWDPKLQRGVAIKVLTEPENESHAARFVREARLGGRLEHPNILPIHDVGRTAEGQLFLVMKRVEGRSLHDVLVSLARHVRHGEPPPKPWNQQRLLLAFVQICRAVEFAHTHGIVHRDIKPANVLLGRFGEVLLFDWGLARRHGDSLEEPPLDEFRTAPGLVVGTPGYMSPEQLVEPDAVDHLSDVWCLGSILYEIVTLRRAFAGRNLDETVAATMKLPPDPRTRGKGWVGSEPLAALCRWALQPRRSARLESAALLADGVEQAVTDGLPGREAAAELIAARDECRRLERLCASIAQTAALDPSTLPPSAARVRRDLLRQQASLYGTVLLGCDRAMEQGGARDAARALLARAEFALLQTARALSDEAAATLATERLRAYDRGGYFDSHLGQPTEW